MVWQGSATYRKCIQIPVMSLAHPTSSSDPSRYSHGRLPKGAKRTNLSKLNRVVRKWGQTDLPGFTFVSGQGFEEVPFFVSRTSRCSILVLFIWKQRRESQLRHLLLVAGARHSTLKSTSEQFFPLPDAGASDSRATRPT